MGKYNNIHSQVWDEIIYPFPNFNEVTIGVWEWISNSIPHFTGYVYIRMLGLKLIHVSNSGPSSVYHALEIS